MDLFVAFDIYSRRATRDFVYNATATSYDPSDNSVRLFFFRLVVFKVLTARDSSIVFASVSVFFRL
jgi:hypothetical protein